MTRTPGVLLTCLTAALLCGCGGGGGGGSGAGGGGGGTDPGERVAFGGVLLDAATDAPVEGAMLTLTPRTRLVARSRQNAYTATTAADGRYDWTDLPPGEYTLTIVLPDGSYRAIEIDLTLSGAQASATLDVRLVPRDIEEPQSLTISPQNATVPVGESLKFTATVTPESELKPFFLLSGLVGMIDRDGTFVAVSPGTATVRAQLGNVSVETTVTVTATGVSIMGLVKDGLTEEGVPDATVTTGGREAQTDSSGAFTVTHVPAGKQTLTVSKAGYEPTATTVTVPESTAGGKPMDVGQLTLAPAGMAPPDTPSLQ